jgi:GT2 family glycosyltransferase
VLCQREHIHEYFVLDGGSTDGSAELIRRLADQGGIDYWHSRRDAGQSDAFAQGFARATGDFLAWLNSDDLFLPGALRRVREALERHPQWDVVTGHHVQIDAGSRIRSMHRIPGESPRMARWGVNHVAQQTCCFRRSLYEEVGGLDRMLHCALDTDLWLRMFEAGARWGHVAEYLAAFRIHETSKGSSWNDAVARERVIVHGRYPQYLETLRRPFGKTYYRLGQIVSGRHLRAALETRAHRGRPVAEVFGDWGGPPAGGRT